MSDDTLREVLEEYLASHGYHQSPADPSYWTVDRGADEFYTDKLIPMVIDCLEQES